MAAQRSLARVAGAGRWLLSLLVLASLLLLAPVANATALTYRVAAHEKACFYTWVNQPGKKVAYYFAVQSGGSFDIDYLVTDPKGRQLLSGEKERQGDYVFTGNEIGEYSFCFLNGMSTFAEKLVDFEISLENEPKPAVADAQKVAGGTSGADEHTNNMDEIVFRLSGQMSTISRKQKYFRTREHRNMATVRSTENRIFYFSLAESAIIVTVAVLQVFIVKAFFGTAKKGRV